MCDKPVHHMCFIDNPMIAKLAAEFELGSWCFDCALLAGVIREKVPSQYSAPYYAQLTDWSAESASTPFAVGALLSSGSLKLSKERRPISTLPLRARRASTSTSSKDITNRMTSCSLWGGSGAGGDGLRSEGRFWLRVHDEIV